MLKNKKVNLVIFFMALITTSISSCGKLDYYEAPVYLKIIKTTSIDPANTETSGTIKRYYKGTTYYPMKAGLYLEAVSVSEPSLDSMKPKGVTLNKIVTEYYPGSNPDLSAAPSITITKNVSLFIPVAKEEKKEETTTEEGAKFYLTVGDRGTIFPNGLEADPLTSFFWTIKCKLHANDERGNEVKAEVFLYLNCYAQLYEEEET